MFAKKWPNTINALLLIACVVLGFLILLYIAPRAEEPIPDRVDVSHIKGRQQHADILLRHSLGYALEFKEGRWYQNGLADICMRLFEINGNDDCEGLLRAWPELYSRKYRGRIIQTLLAGTDHEDPHIAKLCGQFLDNIMAGSVEAIRNDCILDESVIPRTYPEEDVVDREEWLLEENLTALPGIDPIINYVLFGGELPHWYPEFMTEEQKREIQYILLFGENWTPKREYQHYERSNTMSQM